MKVIRLFLKRAGVLLFLLFMAVTGLIAQPNPTYLCELRNDMLVSPTVFEYDMYLLRTGTTEFELTNIQAGINVSPALINGGTITVSIVLGTSELLTAQQPGPANLAFLPASNTIRMTPRANPGAGFGTIISNTGFGTRVGRFRLTNTVAFGVIQPNMTWWFAIPGGYPSKVSAYVGGLAVNITVQASHTTNNLVNPILNLPVTTTYNVTGTGGYCTGGAGLVVGLDGSELGVTYTLVKDGIATTTTFAGTGSLFSFPGFQTVGTYTVTAVRNGTFLTGTMTGSAIITEILSPGAAGLIAGPATVPEGTSGVAYSVPPIANAVSYDWLYSGTGATIVGGAGTNSITVDFAMGATSGALSVHGANSCGNGAESVLDIVVTPNVLPLPIAYDVTGGGSYCQGTTSTVAVGLSNSEVGVTYNLYEAAAPLIPVATVTRLAVGAFSFGFFPAGTYTATGTNASGTTNMNLSAVITETPGITPTFTQLGPYCENAVADPLPGVSIEGYTGTWFPPVISTAPAGSTTYTFIPDPGQGCITGATMVVIVNPLITPTFAQLGPYCENAVADPLPGVSIEGYTGTWVPAVISTAAAGTTTYTFTPNAGQGCITGATMDVVVNPWVTPTFAQLGPYCVGDTPGALPGLSLNGYTGTWVPAVISTAAAGATTYTFTPDAGQGCVTGASMDVIINPWITPTFAQLGPYCINAIADPLPGTSIEGITGTWLPSVISTAAAGSTVYTFTPDPGQGCITNATMTVVVAEPSYTWTGAISNDWYDPNNWFPVGVVPMCCTDVVIPACLSNYPTIVVAGACVNNIHFMSANPPCATATLLDNGFLTIHGVATVERWFDSGGLDWHLISSPVQNALSGVFIGKNLQNYTTIGSLWTDIVAVNIPLNVMEGYAVWAHCDPPCEKVTFTGVNDGLTGGLNLGVQAHPLIWAPGFGWNLLGNPYVSSFDANLVPVPAGMAPVYWVLDAATGNYHWFNVFTGDHTFSGVIPPQQGFFVEAFQPAAPLVLNDVVRTHQDNNVFWKSDDPKLVIVEAAGENYSDQAWIRFNEQANADYDVNYDVHKIVSVSNPLLPQIFSTTSSGAKLALNGLPQTSTVPLSFTAVQSGTFTINAIQTGDFTNVTLEDLFTGKFTDLLTSSYTFTYNAGDQEGRFLLHFNGVSVGENQADLVSIYSSEKNAYVAVPANRTGDVKILNMLGQEVTKGKIVDVLTKFTLNEPGIYVVQASVNGKIYTKKVIIR